ncbi:F-type type IV conjugative transfer system protein TraT [Campylobacter vulpis]|uniref:Conjugal transfer protein TraT n=2 Tax=Campylobacter vulpis TaxID=1655500 RepID=A0A2G4QYQ2_9BACT|nr:complement resistance protein TraT [Campylobacter vulpis]MBS4241268.1 conjugal transfer protein TraT [Campylobacter vulpis]MBS4252625.1 conjugal transfer protein TraT [Campylobacter vulpis]MBS4274842.1 conjugal transfer protein TraT [Campylobacter vulpis]MBS4281920.1 conjugal transfer protein TraT [Campylobacter vulpis]MBS4306421.1 conjugal transfer protein TraT [Campylobacter vulpis]
MRVKIMFSSILVAGLLSGCLTTTLQTNSTMSQSIFLDPVAKEKRIVFLNIKNTSGHNVNLEPKLRTALEAKGYRIVDDPAMANYILSTNILYCDKKQENNAVGGAVAAGAVGAGISAYNSSSAGGAVAAGAAGAIVGGLLGKLTEDTIYQMQVDINIKQKADGKVLTSSSNVSGQASVRNKRSSGFLNSFGGSVRSDKVGHLNSNQVNTLQQSYEGNYIEKSTIIFAEAVKTGLKLEEATPVLEDKIATQIAGLF